MKHFSTTGKSGTLKSKQNPGKSGSKLKKYTGMTHKGGIVSEHYRLQKQKRWVETKHDNP